MENLSSQLSKLNEAVKSAIAQDLGVLFKKFPQLDAIKFQGYTIYFNDGDTCEYSIRGTFFSINNKFYRVDDWGYGEDYKKVDKSLFSDGLREGVDEFFDNLYGITDLVKGAFGDHKQITIYSDGSMEEEDYTDHD